MSERFDIAIIGTGPAGVSAAITGKVRNKKVLLLGDKNLSDKIGKAHTILNYPGLPDIAGEELKDRFLNHLSQMEIQVTPGKANAVYAMGDYFHIQAGTEEYEADTVILSTGVDFGKPYPGEEKFLGRGVSYCATCDAALYKGKTVAMIGFSQKEELEAEFMAEFTSKIYYFPMYKGEISLSDKIEILHEIPLSIEGDRKAERLITKEGQHEIDGIFILRESVSPAQLVPGLTLEDNHIAVNRKMETNIAGCFACGDVTGTPFQYSKSVGEGNLAALSAVSYLDQKKK